jgi:hypothetical protein
LKIGYRSLLYQLFSKRDKKWLKLAKLDRFSNFFGHFSRFSGRGTHRRADSFKRTITFQI